MVGWLLVLGAGAFIVGAANPALFAVWTAPEATQLQLIHGAPTAWAITNILFVLATVLTASGLWLVPDNVGDPGLTIARIASVAYLLGASAWLASLVFRLVVTPDDATTFVEHGSLDPAYAVVARWSGGLFTLFTYVAGSSLVALGVAVVMGATLSALAGWFSIVIGAIIVAGYAIAGDMPPVVAYLPTGLLGITLLLSKNG